MKPVIENVPSIKKPILGSFKNLDDRWSFSFEYFKQVDFFGLGGIDAKWFISLIERLADLSKLNPNTLQKDKVLKSVLRYHKINWDGKNVPYKRNDFNWIKKEIIQNEEEFPFFQFQISKALGRVIGFWDINNSFQIVLLDPLHNMQPSKYNGYEVNDTHELSCELTSILTDIENLREINCEDKNCKVKSEVNKIPTKLNRGNFAYCLLDDQSYKILEDQLDKRGFKDIVESGLFNGI